MTRKVTVGPKELEVTHVPWHQLSHLYIIFVVQSHFTNSHGIYTYYYDTAYSYIYMLEKVDNIWKPAMEEAQVLLT